MYRKFDPISLYGVEYQSGTMFFPDKIKINYRYFPGATTTARLYVMGVLPGETRPKPLCVSYELPISECPRERIMTSVVELKYDTNATEIFLLISNYEYLQDLYSIIGVFEKGEIKYGEVATVESFNCGFALQSFDINNGDIFSFHRQVTLNNTYFGGPPTHYRVSYYADMIGSEWIAYDSAPVFNLEVIGLNTLYFQIKTADEVSEIFTDAIGWHGYSLWYIEETNGYFYAIETTVTTESEIDKSITIRNYNIEEEIPWLDTTITETISKTGGTP